MAALLKPIETVTSRIFLAVSSTCGSSVVEVGGGR
jgi:hypothetical protein